MSEASIFNLIQQIADLNAKPVQSISNNMIKLPLSAAERQAISTIFPADTVQKYYSLMFSPELAETLKNSTLMLRDPVTKQFVSGVNGGQLLQVLQLSSALNVMAVATQQQYLNQINEKLDLISSKLDRILEFLYGDKKAELLAEISFSKYAYENYRSISVHDEQRLATIASLQAGKKIALKDIEFYISDLEMTVQDANSKMPGETEKKAEQALQICSSIDMSIQLYTLNCLLEVYYSRNEDGKYVSYLEEDIRAYVEKCDKRILQDLSTLKAHLTGGKFLGKKNTDLIDRVDQRISDVTNHKIGDKQKEILDALIAVGRKNRYAISSDGDVYIEMK